MDKRTLRIMRHHVAMYCRRCGRRVDWRDVEDGWKGCCPGTTFARTPTSPWKRPR